MNLYDKSANLSWQEVDHEYRLLESCVHESCILNTNQHKFQPILKISWRENEFNESFSSPSDNAGSSIEYDAIHYKSTISYNKGKLLRP